MRTCAGFAVLAVALGACSESAPPPVPEVARLHTDLGWLRDDQGRYVQAQGINVGGSSKVPAAIDASGVPSYVGKPFALEAAREHFGRLRDMGFDSVRLVLMWEGIEPSSRSVFDLQYLAYIRALVQAAGEFRLRVLLDMHQDNFSRHLMVKFNNHPRGNTGDIDNTLFAFLAPYNDTIQGDGAPRWAVQACLPEKDLDSPNWGTPRVLSGLDEKALYDIYNLFIKLTSGGPPAQQGSVAWIVDFLNQKPAPFAPNETTDLLPLTNGAAALSLDVARAYACFFAGDKVLPGQEVDGQNIKDWIQDAYAEAFAQVAAQVQDLPNVMGYDLMNEPSSNFLVLAAYGALARGGLDGVKSLLLALLGPDTGDQVFQVLIGLRLLPPDIQPATLQAWGLDRVDPAAAIALTNGFDENYLRPFYEKVGRAILQYDSKAVFFVEGSLGLNMFLGGPAGGIGGIYEVPMTRPDLPQVVFAPHYYTDIYPFVGVNQPPRDLTASEVRYRDLQPALVQARSLATYSMSDLPSLFGEFGTFFSFNGIYNARQEDYLTSACLLDDYYEALERMGAGNMLWCYSSQNTFDKGDGWNHEDFSVIDQDGSWRGQLAWARPHARALAGKPISSHFWSDYHYFDPDKGQVPPLHEFEVRYQSKESAAPTEILVPDVQYPNGFYVWISDGRCFFDSTTRTLFHYPANDAPGAEHFVRLLPPLDNNPNVGWRYFFEGDHVIERE
jgi:hypothetical protein